MALMHSCSVSCESHVAALTNQIVGLLQLSPRKLPKLTRPFSSFGGGIRAQDYAEKLVQARLVVSTITL